jgi:hypothetical protein
MVREYSHAICWDERESNERKGEPGVCVGEGTRLQPIYQSSYVVECSSI